MNIIQKDKFGIYALFCPETKKPFYVGCSQNVNTRFKNHNTIFCGKTLTAKELYINNLKQKGLDPFIKIIDWASTIEDAEKKEEQYIIEYKLKYQILNERVGSMGLYERYNQKEDLIYFRIKKKTKVAFSKLVSEKKSTITKELTQYMEYQIKKHGK